MSWASPPSATLFALYSSRGLRRCTRSSSQSQPVSQQPVPRYPPISPKPPTGNKNDYIFASWLRSNTSHSVRTPSTPANMAQQNGKKPVSNLSSALASIHISQQNPDYSNTSHFNNHNESGYRNDPNMHYHHSQSMDIPMRPQTDFTSQIPLDRIAEYCKNPPTEGISLFSHRVSFFYCYQTTTYNTI